MTTIPDTTTEKGQREASVMLAQLRGWDVSFGLIDSDQSWDGFAHDTLTITTEDGEWCDNLYNPAHMALAWRVVCWFVDPKNDPMFVWFDEKDRPRYYAGLAWRVWWNNSIEYYNETAQKAWLDKVLLFAHNAGMV